MSIDQARALRLVGWTMEVDGYLCAGYAWNGEHPLLPTMFLLVALLGRTLDIVGECREREIRRTV